MNMGSTLDLLVRDSGDTTTLAVVVPGDSVDVEANGASYQATSGPRASRVSSTFR